jgi:hypothetical protein
VRDLTRDGRWSTYDVSVLKKMGGRCAKTGDPLKLPTPTKLARLGHFPPAGQAGRLAGPVFYVYVFSLGQCLLCMVRVDKTSLFLLWSAQWQGGGQLLPSAGRAGITLIADFTSGGGGGGGVGGQATFK